MLGFALVDPHQAFLRLETGEKFAQQQEDQARVGEQDAGLAPLELEAIDVRGQEIDEQQAADKVAAGESRHRDAGVGNLLQYDE